jgi:glycosyltransferase involved in cell wall biosynthesis
VKRISLVVPVFNEEEAIPIFISCAEKTFSNSPYLFEYIFVNDGSTDSTWEVLQKFSDFDNIVCVNLTRNFGKEAALTAGLEFASGDAVVPLDVDLQDPLEVVLEMLAKWELGVEVVLGKRSDRSSDSWVKRTSARWFYTIHNHLSDNRIPENVGDFRLMDRRVVESISKLPENRRFMKGIFSWVGYKTDVVEYRRPERLVGTTKFNGWKLWNFALEGITSFSTAPLRIWTYLGLAVSIFSFMYGSFLLIRTLLYGVDAPGYASIMVSILFLGGVQLIGIGILGEYIGRIYMEAKHRPVYLVDTVTNGNVSPQ